MLTMHFPAVLFVTNQGILVLWLHGLSDLPHGEGEAAEPQETEESPPPLQPGYQPAQKKERKVSMFASGFFLTGRLRL
jgi:hypothetical protein